MSRTAAELLAWAADHVQSDVDELIASYAVGGTVAGQIEDLYVSMEITACRIFIAEARELIAIATAPTMALCGCRLDWNCAEHRR